MTPTVGGQAVFVNTEKGWGDWSPNEPPVAVRSPAGSCCSRHGSALPRSASGAVFLEIAGGDMGSACPYIGKREPRLSAAR